MCAKLYRFIIQITDWEVTHFMVSKKPIFRNLSLKREVSRYSSWKTLKGGCSGVIEHQCWWFEIRIDVCVASGKVFSAVEKKCIFCLWLFLPHPSWQWYFWRKNWSGFSRVQTWLFSTLNTQEFYVLLTFVPKAWTTPSSVTHFNEVHQKMQGW